MEHDQRQQRQEQGVRAIPAQVLAQRHLDACRSAPPRSPRTAPARHARSPRGSGGSGRTRRRSPRPGSAAPTAAAGAMAPAGAHPPTADPARRRAALPLGAPWTLRLPAARSADGFACACPSRRRRLCPSRPVAPSRRPRRWTALARTSATAPVAIRHGVSDPPGFRPELARHISVDASAYADFDGHASAARSFRDTRRPRHPR